MTETSSSPPASAPHRLRSLVMKNAAISVGARVVYMASRFFLPPIILRHVSLELYGVWAACFILIGYFGMSAFGVSNVYIRYVAGHYAKGAWDEINKLLSTGIAVTLAASAVLLAGLWLLLPAVVSGLHISPEYRRTAAILIFGTSATFVLDLSLGAFGHVLTALQRVGQSTALWIVSVAIETVLILGLLPVCGVYALLIAFAVRYVFVTIASAICCARALPHLRVSRRYFDRQTLSLFYRYGGVVQLSGLLGMFLYSAEKIIAGVFIGVSATGLFDLGEKFAVMGSQVASSVNGVILPAASHLHTMDDRARIVTLYLRASRYLSLLAAAISGFLPAFAGPIMTMWLGANPALAVATTILMLFALPFHVHVLTGPGSAVHRGTDRPARELVYPLWQLALVIVGVAAGFALAGRSVMTVAVAVSTSMLASQLIYMAYTNRKLGVAQGAYARRVLLPTLLPYAAAVLVRIAFAPWLHAAGTARWALAAVMAPAGVLYLLLTGILFWLGAETEERGLAVSLARRLTTRRGAAQTTPANSAAIARPQADQFNRAS